jgi:hypothetical protein
MNREEEEDRKKILKQESEGLEVIGKICEIISIQQSQSPVHRDFTQLIISYIDWRKLVVYMELRSMYGLKSNPNKDPKILIMNYQLRVLRTLDLAEGEYFVY